MSEAPISTVSNGRDENDEEWGPTEYIRSDLVDKLIGYAVHDGDCDAILSNGYNKDGSLKYGPCTCGLSDLIKELRQ